MNFRSLFLIGAVALCTGTSAWAHHSFAMFDSAKTTMLEGTVKDFQWTNPHSWVQLLVTDKDGQTAEWGLELSSVTNLARAGWKPKALKPGDKITAVIHPLKDGTHGGELFQVILPDGKPISGLLPRDGGVAPGSQQ